MVPHVADVKIRQFWTEVPSPSFLIAQLKKKKKKTERAKNNVFKSHGAKKYLTLKNISYVTILS
jgi:hypothetical protein